MLCTEIGLWVDCCNDENDDNVDYDVDIDKALYPTSYIYLIDFWNVK